MSGSWDLRPKKYEGAGRRYLRFREYLDQLLNHTRIDIVWFEAVRRHLGTDAAHIYGGLMGTLEVWCEDRGIPYEGVPVQTIKKFWTNKGNASKDEMIAMALKRGHNPIDNNECDAIALLVLKDPDAEGLGEPKKSFDETFSGEDLLLADALARQKGLNLDGSKRRETRQRPGLNRGASD